jgi:hypothetical protein
MLSPTQLTVIGLAGIPADTTITAITAVPDIARRCVSKVGTFCLKHPTAACLDQLDQRLMRVNDPQQWQRHQYHVVVVVGMKTLMAVLRASDEAVVMAGATGVLIHALSCGEN